MKWLPGPDTRAAVLKHPFVLAGLAVVVLLGLTAAALIVVDSARGSDSRTPRVVVDPVSTGTAGPTSKTAEATGVRGTTNITATVRSAPGERSPVLGTLPRNTDVVIDGRTTDTNWLRIIFPTGSELHGWVDAELLDIIGDPTSLVVATAEPAPRVELPTVDPAFFTPTPEDGTPTPTGTPDLTLTPAGLPDLVVGTTPTIAGGKLFVTVVNQGTGPMTGDLVVAIFNAEGTALLGGATLPEFTLEPGRSIDIGTGFEVTENQVLLLIVDPNGDIEEADNTNNQITVSIAVGNPPPQDTPEPEPPTEPATP